MQTGNMFAIEYPSRLRMSVALPFYFQDAYGVGSHFVHITYVGKHLMAENGN